MNKSVGIATAIGIIIIIGVIVYQVNETMWTQVTVEEYYEREGKVSSVVFPENPQILGPLQINKDKYLLGENVFVYVKDLRPQDVGFIDVFTPDDQLYTSIKFDGSIKPYVKKYFKPQLLKTIDVCNSEELVGEWKIVFRDLIQYELKFEVVNSILPNQESQYEDCDEPLQINIKP